MFRVVILDYLTPPLTPELKVLGDIAEVTALNAFSEAELVGRVEQAQAVMLYHNLGLSRASIERFEQCRAIVRCGVGIDNVDLAAARARGIPVMNVPDYGTEDVADSALGMLLCLTRGLHDYNSRLRANAGKWDYSVAAPLFRLRGRTLGIIGLGRIGTALALRAKSLGMRVIYYDPHSPDGRDKSLGVERVEQLGDFWPQCHAVSLHCPLTPETRHMVNAQAIGQLPRGAFLVNTARGRVVDTAAIPEAIASGQLAGAAIDVLHHEPPTNDPLVIAWRDPNHLAHHRVIINPHSAFYTEEGLIDMRVKGSQACRRALLGEPLRNVVN